MHFVSSPLTEKTVRRRATNIGVEDTTHSAICCNHFAQQGKRAFHIFVPVFAQSGVLPAHCADARVVRS